MSWSLFLSLVLLQSSHALFLFQSCKNLSTTARLLRTRQEPRSKKLMTCQTISPRETRKVTACIRFFASKHLENVLSSCELANNHFFHQSIHQIKCCSSLQAILPSLPVICSIHRPASSPTPYPGCPCSSSDVCSSVGDPFSKSRYLYRFC